MENSIRLKDLKPFLGIKKAEGKHYDIELMFYVPCLVPGQTVLYQRQYYTRQGNLRKDWLFDNLLRAISVDVTKIYFDSARQIEKSSFTLENSSVLFRRTSSKTLSQELLQKIVMYQYKF
jgi:hypothetical protein